MNIRFIRIAFESVKGMKVYISIPFIIFHRIYTLCYGVTVTVVYYCLIFCVLRQNRA